MRPLFHTLCIAVALLPQSLGAQDVRACSTPTSASGFCFVLDVIEALSHAHTAALTRPDTVGVTGNTVGMGAALLYVSGRQRTGLEMALRTLRPYVRTTDTIVRGAAAELVESLLALHAYSLASDSSLRAILDGKEGSASAQAQALADLQNRRHAAASMLVLSTIAATYSLLESDPADSSRMRLSMRASERTALQNRLRERFRDALRPAAKSGQYSTDYAAAAKMLDEFLAQEWRTRP